MKNYIVRIESEQENLVTGKLSNFHETYTFKNFNINKRVKIGNLRSRRIPN